MSIMLKLSLLTQTFQQNVLEEDPRKIFQTGIGAAKCLVKLIARPRFIPKISSRTDALSRGSKLRRQ